MTQKKVKLFALTTCGFCRRARAYFLERGIPCETVDVDRLSGEEPKAALEELRSHNPRRSFPTIVIGDEVVVGFKKSEIQRILGDG